MKAADFTAGDRFRLKSPGWDKARFEVIGHGESERFGPYIRVKDLSEPGYAPMWIFGFQLDMYAERKVIALEKRKATEPEFFLDRDIIDRAAIKAMDTPYGEVIDMEKCFELVEN